jgi:hypothetical protein
MHTPVLLSSRPLSLCSYYDPDPPQNVKVNVKTFDGINLERPGSDASRTGVHIVYSYMSGGCCLVLVGNSKPPAGLSLA